MSETRNAVLTVNFIDGSTKSFGFTRQSDLSTAMTKFREASSNEHIILDMSEKVLLIPMSAIKSIEVYPRPNKLPPYAVPNVKEIGV